MVRGRNREQSAWAGRVEDWGSVTVLSTGCRSRGIAQASLGRPLCSDFATIAVDAKRAKTRRTKFVLVKWFCEVLWREIAPSFTHLQPEAADVLGFGAICGGVTFSCYA